MKKKTLAKFAAAFAAVTVIAGAMPVFAAGTDYTTEIGGTKTTTFEKYLVMDADANVPNASFTYAVTAGEAVAYSDTSIEILAGVDADKVTMAGVGSETANTIKYAPGDTTANDVNTKVKNYDNKAQKYALKTATLDFSACAFKEPGVYRYVITESGTNQAVTNDDATKRYIDVYVEDSSDTTAKKLNIAGYVLHTTASSQDAAGTNPDGKSQGFTNSYDTSDLTFRNEVSGNQASHDKYFKYTVEIDGAVPGTVYTVDLSGADATSGSNSATKEEYRNQKNSATITVDEDGKATVSFYLQHGQEITIQGVSKDTKYKVTADGEDYTLTEKGVTGYNDETSGTIESTDVKTSYMANRAGTIPTGVMLTVAPFAAITVLGAAGMIKFRMNGRKKDSEE